MRRVLSILLGGMLVLTLTGCGNEVAKESEENQKEYYCEAGTLNGENCEVVETEEVTTTYEEDYKLTDGKCVKTTTTNAKATKTCSDGYTLSGSNCLSTKTYDKVTTKECQLPAKFANDNYAGNKAYVKNGECWYIACTDFDNGECVGGEENRTEFTTVTSCPSGTKEVSGKCYKTSTVKTTYTCETGTLSGSKCTITDTKEITNTCKTEGFSYNTESSQCEKVTTTKALEK